MNNFVHGRYTVPALPTYEMPKLNFIHTNIKQTITVYINENQAPIVASWRGFIGKA